MKLLDNRILKSVFRVSENTYKVGPNIHHVIHDYTFNGCGHKIKLLKWRIKDVVRIEIRNELRK